MIEATNSVLSNASVTRVAAEQQSTARSLAANPQRVQEVARTPYISPYISIDRGSNRAVLQIRDSDTGDVLRQYPTESQLKAYRNAQQTTEREQRVENAILPDNGSDTSAPKANTGGVPLPSIQTEA